MTKNDYLAILTTELEKNNVGDAQDIISEYEQHFAFKLADGFTEEEIAAKLGDPFQLASQFEGGAEHKKSSGRKWVTTIGLGFADFFTGIFFLVLFAWEVIMAAFSLACGTLALCLIGGFNIQGLIPPIPYGCGIILAVAIAALAVLTATGSVYFAALTRQLMRCYGRFHRNMLASATDGVTLPSLAMRPQFSARRGRRLRSVALFTLIVFVLFLVLGMIVCMISAGALEFWHAWNWFIQ